MDERRTKFITTKFFNLLHDLEIFLKILKARSIGVELSNRL